MNEESQINEEVEYNNISTAQSFNQSLEIFFSNNPDFFSKMIEELGSIKFGYINRYIGNLKFQDKANFTDEEVGQYVGNLPINSLNLDNFVKGVDGLTNRAAATLASNSHIQSLSIEENELDDEGVRLLTSNRSITSLKIGGNPITDESLKLLANNPRLKELSLRAAYETLPGIGDYREGTAIVSATNTHYFTDNKNLSSLNLEGNFIGDEGLIHLPLNRLVSLNLACCGISASSIPLLAESSSLTELDISSSLYEEEYFDDDIDDTYPCTRDIPQGSLEDEDVQSFFYNYQLTSLVIDNHQLSDTCQQALAQHIGQNKQAALIKKSFNWKNRFGFFKEYNKSVKKESELYDIDIVCITSNHTK